MSFIDALYSGDHAKAKSHIRNLVRIACADGNIDDAEFKLLLRIARKYEIDVIVSCDDGTHDDTCDIAHRVFFTLAC